MNARIALANTVPSATNVPRSRGERVGESVIFDPARKAPEKIFFGMRLEKDWPGEIYRVEQPRIERVTGMRKELQDNIVKWLREQGVISYPSGPLVAVNRTSMCCSRFRGEGIPEEVTYPRVLEAIRKQFPHLKGYNWFAKSDEDLFLDTLDGNQEVSQYE
jgi:hypothetical protein